MESASDADVATATVPPLPPPPTPPDCRRYWALWKEERCKPKSGAPFGGRQQTFDTSTIDRWSAELELARYNRSVRDRVDELRRKVEGQQRQAGEGTCPREVEHWMRQIEALLLELDLVLIFPRAFKPIFLDRNEDAAFWIESLPRSVMHDKSFAWLLLGFEKDLPIPFQEMLWMDPACPLRAERDILLASLEKGLDSYIRIVWSDEMTDDGELLMKCLETCPKCIVVHDGNNYGLPLSCLQDLEMLRKLANSSTTRDLITVVNLFRTHSRFSQAIIENPTVAADLLIGLTCKYLDQWVTPSRRRDFSNGAPSYWQQLLDSLEFALHLANGLAKGPDASRRLCPVKYRTLSRRLRETPEVALAFVRLDSSNARDLPLALSNNTEAWRELWNVATDENPAAVYFECFRAHPCSELLASKNLVLRLLEVTSNLGSFREAYIDLSPEIKRDREVNVQLVLTSSSRRWTELYCHVAPTWTHDRRFWTHLAEVHHCPCSVWDHIPGVVQADASVAFAWGRYARPDAGVQWIEDAVTNFPQLRLLSDRQVLLNWIPKFSGSDPRSTELFRHVSQAHVDDKSLWLELFSRERPCDCLHHIPESLRRDPEVVDAHLRWCVANRRLFLSCYKTLPLVTQYRFAHHLTEAIKRSPNLVFSRDWDSEVKPELWRIPDVALAAIEKGWRPQLDIVKSSTWSKDPSFLLSVAKLSLSDNDTFWCCCSDSLRRDKAFLLRIVKLDRVPWMDIGEELESDFDIMCARFVGHDAQSREESWEPSKREVEFVDEVRRRLTSYLSLETFVSGVASGTRDDDGRCLAGPATLLGQDRYTLEGLKHRLAEYLGSPSREEAARLRKVSNSFTKYGY